MQSTVLGFAIASTCARAHVLLSLLYIEIMTHDPAPKLPLMGCFAVETVIPASPCKIAFATVGFMPEIAFIGSITVFAQHLVIFFLYILGFCSAEIYLI